MFGWNAQIAKDENDYRIQIETDDFSKYKVIEEICHGLVDGTFVLERLERFLKDLRN